MTSVFGIGLSAVKAFGRKMEIIGENVANLYSQGYRKKRALIKEQQDGGVVVEIQSSSPPNKDVDLTAEIPQSIITQRGYEANLKTVQTEDKLLGTVIDIMQ